MTTAQRAENCSVVKIDNRYEVTGNKELSDRVRKALRLLTAVESGELRKSKKFADYQNPLRKGHTDGWNACLGKIDELLQEG